MSPIPVARTVPAALAALLARDPARPLVTQVGPGGERVELSVRTFENNVAKTANLLLDDADLQPGRAVAIRLPLHWQCVVWAAAAGATGGVAWLDGPAEDPSVDVAVLGPRSLDDGRAPLTLATSLHPLGLPFAAPLPTGLLDAGTEVRAHGDRFAPHRPAQPDDPWLRTGETLLTQEEALLAAADLAGEMGAEPGSRVLCARPLVPGDLGSALMLAALPLAVDAAVVLLTDPGADPAETARREGCTTILR